MSFDFGLWFSRRFYNSAKKDAVNTPRGVFSITIKTETIMFTQFMLADPVMGSLCVFTTGVLVTLIAYKLLSLAPKESCPTIPEAMDAAVKARLHQLHSQMMRPGADIQAIMAAHNAIQEAYESFKRATYGAPGK